MAKKNGVEKSIEVNLWDAANKLRGSVEPAEYKHIVLSLIFLVNLQKIYFCPDTYHFKMEQRL